MAIDFGTITRALKLPEMGISEMLGGNTDSLNMIPPKKVVDSFLSKATATQSVAPRSVAPTSRTSSGGGSGIPDYSGLLKSTKSNVDTTRDYALELERERKRQEEEERKRILKQTRKSYDPFFADLTQQEKEIPVMEQNYLNTLNTGFQNQTDTINRGQEAGLAQAEASAGTIKQNQATSLRDLASNLSSAVNAFGQRLGQAGAGDSSAANMANYAYSKLANRNTADIMSQVRGELAKVEQAKIGIVNDAKDKLSALSMWKANQMQEITTKVQAMKDYLRQARLQGKMALSENEVDMIRQGFEVARQRMQQVNDLAVTTRAGIEQAAAQALIDAQSFTSQLAAMGNTNPADINVGEVDTGSIADGGTEQLPVLGLTDETKDQSLSDLLYGTIPSGLAPSTGY